MKGLLVPTNVKVSRELYDGFKVFKDSPIIFTHRVVRKTCQLDVLSTFNHDVYLFVHYIDRHHKLFSSVTIFKHELDNCLLVVLDCFSIASAQRAKEHNKLLVFFLNLAEIDELFNDGRCNLFL